MGRIETKFKQTEVGLVPEDWEVKTIGDCCKIFGRIGFRGYTINDIVEEGFGSITISPSNIIDGKVNFDKCTYLSWFKYEESPEIKIFNGDILLVKTGSTFGKTAIVKGLNLKATINPQIVVLKNIEINRILLGYIMGFNDVQNYIKSSVVGGAIPTLSQKQISNFKIFLPPNTTEQTAIANALSDADLYIESLEKLIAKKQKIKQGAMQQLLKPKPHWEVKKLGEVIHLQGGYAFKSELFTDIGIPIIRISNIDNDLVSLENSIYYKKFNIQKEFIVKKGDALIAMSGATTGKIGVYNDEKEAYINQRVGKFVVLDDKKYSYEFVSHIIRSKKFLEELFKQISQGAQPNISGKQIEFIELSFPKNVIEQKEIAQTLSDIDSEITAITKKLTKAKAIKQGMMQQLLTGKIRLI